MFAATHRKKVLFTTLLGSVWLISLGLGVRSLLSYETTPGITGAPPTAWPAASKIPLAPDRPTLIMLAHPHCPCTQASVDELAKIMAHTNRRPAAYVLLLKPPNTDRDWDDTALRQTAARIPGVTVVTDLDGIEASRFGAETSGHTLLFDSAGSRLFSGGITTSRGHAGDNAGEDAIVSLIERGEAARSSTLVFGCGLTDSKTIFR